jgi:hypothetical protein
MHLKITFLDGPLPHTYCMMRGFWEHALWDPTLMVKIQNILTNSAHTLTTYRVEFKCGTNRIRKYLLLMPRFEPQTLNARPKYIYKL